MKKTLLYIFLTIILSLSFFLTTLTITDANQPLLSRAGGGEGFGDGGFDLDFGSDSFDFGSSDSLWDSSGNSYDYEGGGGFGFCGILILIIIVVIIIIASKKKGPGTPGNIPQNSQPDTSTKGQNATNKSQTATEIKENIKKLKEIDAKFDEQKFKNHSKKVFMAVQEGWTNRDQEICRPFMGEEVYQSHQMQIDNLKKNKVINVLENIVVGSTEFARIELNEDYHKITMKVRAAMKDYKVKEDEPKKVIEGDKNQSPPFTEFWSFIRKSNLKTKDKDGIFDRKCPNCGAPIDVDVAGECKYCNANVVNGDFDWILSEIIQKSEWQE